MKIKETEFLRQMNEQLQNEIERKCRIIHTSLIYYTEKRTNSKFKRIVDEICSKNTQKALIPLYQKINHLLANNLNTEDDWKIFLIKFEQKHHNFSKH